MARVAAAEKRTAASNGVELVVRKIADLVLGETAEGFCLETDLLCGFLHGDNRLCMRSASDSLPEPCDPASAKTRSFCDRRVVAESARRRRVDHALPRLAAEEHELEAARLCRPLGPSCPDSMRTRTSSTRP